MMPRLFCLVAVLSCAGCVGNQKLSQIEHPQPVLTSAKPSGTSHQSARPRTRLGKLQPLACQGERYDDRLIEEDSNQVFLRPINP